MREAVIEKPSTDASRHDAHYTATHISIAPPEPRLELHVRDTRQRAMPGTLGAVHAALEQPLRSSDRHGAAPVGHPSDAFYDAAAARAPPQPMPDATRKAEDEFLETIAARLKGSRLQGSIQKLKPCGPHHFQCSNYSF